MLKIFDDRQRRLFFARPPARIVSLVPSDTETLFAIGAGDRVVGRTEYCAEPAGLVDRIPTVGGTKNVDLDAVAALAPDLVVANQEENARAQVEALIARKLNVFIGFQRRVMEGVAHVARMARLLGVERSPGVTVLLRRSYHELAVAEREAKASTPVTVFAPIWHEPLMTMSAATFGSDMLALCGARNVFAERARRYPLAADLGEIPARDASELDGRDTRYPRITEAELVTAAPELILLPDEPFAFGAAEREYFLGLDTPASRAGRVVLCDGKDLFWYGARSVDAVARLRAVIAGAR